MKIALISCVKTKRNVACKAAEMYISTWFKNAYKYAIHQKPDKIFILSAKYGLLDADEIIEPYEQVLSNRTSECKKWAEGVVQKLSQKCDLQKDEFIILAGEKYRKFIIPHLHNSPLIPLKGLRQGEQNQFFNKYFQGQHI